MYDIKKTTTFIKNDYKSVLQSHRVYIGYWSFDDYEERFCISFNRIATYKGRKKITSALPFRMSGSLNTEK